MFNYFKSYSTNKIYEQKSIIENKMQNKGT